MTSRTRSQQTRFANSIAGRKSWTCRCFCLRLPLPPAFRGERYDEVVALMQHIFRIWSSTTTRLHNPALVGYLEAEVWRGVLFRGTSSCGWLFLASRCCWQDAPRHISPLVRIRPAIRKSGLLRTAFGSLPRPEAWSAPG